jgi:hypothetical protein
VMTQSSAVPTHKQWPYRCPQSTPSPDPELRPDMPVPDSLPCILPQNLSPAMEAGLTLAACSTVTILQSPVWVWHPRSYTVGGKHFSLPSCSWILTQVFL